MQAQSVNSSKLSPFAVDNLELFIFVIAIFYEL